MPNFVVEGDPEAIAARAAQLRTQAGVLVATGDALAKISTDSWRGRAADKFRVRFEQEPSKWVQAGEGWFTAAGALSTFASVLTTVQADMTTQKARWDASLATSAQAKAAWDADVAAGQARKAQWEAVNGAGTFELTIVPFRDPGERVRDEVASAVAALRQEYESAAANCAAGVRAGYAAAPQARSWLDQVGEFGSGVWDGVKGLGSLVVNVSLGGVKDAYSIASGDLTAEEVLAQRQMQLEQVSAMWGAFTSDPKAFAQNVGKAVLDWDTWADNPARAMGRLVPDAVIAALTVGTGAVASRGASSAARIAGSADEIAAGARAAERVSQGLRLIDGGTGLPSWSRLTGLPSSRGTRAVLGVVQDCGDPIDVASGAVKISEVDARVEGALPLVFNRSHLSSALTGGLFGPAWSSLLDERLEFADDAVRYVDATGSMVVFSRSDLESVGAAWSSQGQRLVLTRLRDVVLAGGVPAGLAAVVDGWVVADPAAARSWVFVSGATESGRAWLVGTADRHRSWIVIDRDDAGLPSQVRTSGGAVVAVDLAAAAGQVRVQRLDLVRGVDVSADDVVEPIALARYEYDEQGNLSQVSRGGQPMRYGYDGAGRVTWWIDRNGTRYDYTFDSAGRCVRGRGSGGFLDVDLVFDGERRVITDSTGVVTEYLVNERQQVVGTRDALGRRTSAVWDAYDRPVTLTDVGGRVTRYDYTDAGDVATIEDFAGRRREFEWAGAGVLTAVSDSSGAVARYRYDEMGNLAEVVDSSGAVTSFTHNENGFVTSVAGPGGELEYEVGTSGAVSAVRDPAGARTHFGYDAFGRVAAVTDSLGGVVRREFAPSGLLLSQIDADGGRQSWQWDGEENLVAHTDAAGRVTRFEYTPFDQPKARIAADGARTEVLFDTEHRMLGVLDAMGRTWEYRLDAAGQLIGEVDVNGRQVEYERDVLGRVVLRRNALGDEVRFEYTAADQVSMVDAAGAVMSYAYDRAGRLVGSHSDDVRHEMAYDVQGRLTSESWNGRSVLREYGLGESLGDSSGPGGFSLSRVTPSGLASTWRVDSAGRPVALSFGGHQVGLEYDRLGREVTRNFGGMSVSSSWSPSGRLLEQVARPQVGDRVGRRAYGYGPAGDLLALGLFDGSTGGVEQTFELDPLGRVLAQNTTELASVRVNLGEAAPSAGSSVDATQRFAYDAAGSLVAADGQARELAGTLVRRAGRAELSYDAAGRLVQRRVARPSLKAAVWQYRYDALDRLVEVHTPDGERWAYVYDGLNRRVAKTQFSAAGEVVSEQSAAWDGAALAETTTVSARGTVTQSWEYHPGSGHPVAQTTLRTWAEGEPGQDWFDREFHAITTDLVGTPTHLYAPDGTQAWAASVDLWGAPVDSWTANAAAGEWTVTCPLRFPGQILDDETGLHYNVNRYYDPTTGSYITPDPLGLAPGPNPHTYVPNPTTWSDPLGLTSCKITLYHATLARHEEGIRSGIDLSYSRRKLDFGPGFYTTTDKAQAAIWAQKLTAKVGEETTILRFDVPVEEFNQLSHLQLSPGSAWKSFVLRNRRGAAMHSYDVVSGPMAPWPKLLPAFGSQISFHTADSVAILDRAIQ